MGNETENNLFLSLCPDRVIVKVWNVTVTKSQMRMKLSINDLTFWEKKKKKKKKKKRSASIFLQNSFLHTIADQCITPLSSVRKEVVIFSNCHQHWGKSFKSVHSAAGGGEVVKWDGCFRHILIHVMRVNEGWLKSTSVESFYSKTCLFFLIRLKLTFFFFFARGRPWEVGKVCRLTHRARWELKYKSESVRPLIHTPGRKVDKSHQLGLYSNHATVMTLFVTCLLSYQGGWLLS